MSKSIKLNNNQYWDSTGITHSRQKLSDLLTTLNNNISALQTSVNKLTPTAWNTISLNSNWSKFGDEFNVPSCIKIGNMVCLKGLLKRNSSMVGSETIGTLPVGFRPNKRVLVNSLTSFNTIQRIDIHSTGEIKTPSTVSSDSMLSLESIIFFID